MFRPSTIDPPLAGIRTPAKNGLSFFGLAGGKQRRPSNSQKSKKMGTLIPSKPSRARSTPPTKKTTLARPHHPPSTPKTPHRPPPDGWRLPPSRWRRGRSASTPPPWPWTRPSSLPVQSLSSFQAGADPGEGRGGGGVRHIGLFGDVPSVGGRGFCTRERGGYNK